MGVKRQYGGFATRPASVLWCFAHPARRRAECVRLHVLLSVRCVCTVRLFRITLLLAALLCVPFFLWGGAFTEWFTGTAGIDRIRSWGAWGGLLVVLLLVGDLVLPVPSTAVMSAAGYLYGTLQGGLIGAAGSFLSGLLAYGLARSCGHALTRHLVEGDELERTAGLFARRGALLIAVSRWMPLLPEVSCCMAGLVQMPVWRFTVALACGAVPVGFAFAAIGSSGQESPAVAIVMSILAPAALWVAARLCLGRAFLKQG